MSRIFVSSTFEDLKDYRKEVSLQLKRMQHEDIAMEYFVSENERPLDKCLKALASCDLYIGIFAWRYGYIPPRKKKSMTELEYREAVKSRKPCLIFLLDEDVPWPPKFVEKDENAIKIEKLRKELSKRYQRICFKNPQELASLVGAAVHNWEMDTGKSPKKEMVRDLDIKSYTEAIGMKYKTLDLDTLIPSKKEDYLKVQLSNVFVEQNVRENPPPIELPKEILIRIQEEWDIDKKYLPDGLTQDDIKRAKESYYSKIPVPVLDVITDIKNKNLVILGDPGSGKSTLARYILLSVLNLNKDDRLNKRYNGYFPLLIELREFIGLCSNNTCKTFLDYFQHLGDTQGYHLKADEIHGYLKDNGKALVIFDGLDEIFDSEKWENVNRMIAGFSIDYPKVQIIVTSRIVGYNPKILANASFTQFTLQEFEEKHIKLFLDRWYSLALYDNQKEANERKQRIIKSLKDSSSIRQLAGNPLLLTILAIIGKHQELPRERWKLYDHAAGVLVEHWEVNRHLKDVKLKVGFIGEEDKKELLRLIAFKMQSGPKGLAGNYIHRTELQEEIQVYIQNRYKEKPANAKVIAESIIDQLRKRNFILCLHGADYYGFIHRTFLEYFCASSIVEKFNDHKINIENLKNDFYGIYWEDKTWHEVLRLICGMKEIVVNDIIQYLMQIYHPQWYGKRPPWNIVLAIKCLSEIRNLEAIDETAKKLLLRIFELFDMVRWTKDINQFLGEEIVPAVKLVAKNWPHRDIVAKWISQTDYGYDLDSNFPDPMLSNAWAEFATDLGSKEICLHIT